jgi:peptidoglycan LD-endopeptidase LytH
VRSHTRTSLLFRALLGVAAVVLATPFAPASAADPLAAAQAQLTDALRSANAAAAAYDEAQTAYYRLEDDAARARHDIANLRREQGQLARLARLRAVAAYKGGTPLFDGLLGSDSNVLDAARRATLLDRVDARGNAAMEQLGAVTDDLHAHEAELRKELKRSAESLAELKKQEDAELQAVADARRAEQSVRAELARQQRLREYEAVVARARAAAAAAASPSSAGGHAAQIVVHGTWVCPVQGSVSFTDTWGAPRGNGRTHKGTDMFAATGTPVVAVTSGSVFFQGDALGGNAAYLNGGDGNTYYYAHLNDYVGGARSVSAGELIGHVGNTGDASGGPSHLHFEIRPGGPNGAQIDPYPTLAAHC